MKIREIIFGFERSGVNFNNREIPERVGRLGPFVSWLYTSAPKIMIKCYTVPETWHATDVIVTFHFGPFFALLPPLLTAWKIKISKNEKKYLEISSFYTSIPKLMIICYTFPEIWHVTDVIVIFHFRLFLASHTPKY